MFIDTQSIYFIQAKFAHTKWCEAQRKKPSLINKTTKGVQDRINKVIPEKIHQAVTAAIKHFIKAVLFGAGITTFSRLGKDSLEETEEFVKRRIGFYSSSSAAEGAITGFGGFLAGMADFPLWLSIKMKLLFEVAQAYSMDVREYQERVYMLYIFQLTFSSQKSRAEIFRKLENWEEEKENLPRSYRPGQADPVNSRNWCGCRSLYQSSVYPEARGECDAGVQAALPGVWQMICFRACGNVT